MLQKVNADNDINEQQPDIAREFVLPFVHLKVHFPSFSWDPSDFLGEKSP